VIIQLGPRGVTDTSASRDILNQECRQRTLDVIDLVNKVDLSGRAQPKIETSGHPALTLIPLDGFLRIEFE
jgi:hypothetical protein